MKASFRLYVIVRLSFYCVIPNTLAMMGYINTNIMLPDILSWIVSDANSVTLSECLMLCQMSTACRGITYQRSTDSCKLLSYDYTDSAHVTTSSIGSSASSPDQATWIFYHVIRDCQRADCLIHVGYTFYAEVCFCMKYHSTQKSYHAAGLHCQIEGGELIKIDKPIVQVFVEYYLDHLDEGVRDRVYIQGQKVGNKWLYDDGTELQYYKWAMNQPNNNIGEDILFLSTPDKWTWQDGGPGSYSFLCKINLLS